MDTLVATNVPMVSDKRCRQCFAGTYNRLFEKFGINGNVKSDFFMFFNDFMDSHNGMSSVEIQRMLGRRFVNMTGITDPYVEEKEESNNISLVLYKTWKPRVVESENPFETAVRLSIAGNIMDYGANHDFDINTTIQKVLSVPFAINHTVQMRERVATANQVLYLGDNAGEIVFDKLLIETMMHPNLIYAVKGAPVLNDVTMIDALQCEMDVAADVIHNGYDAPSTVLPKCSKEFQKIFETSDVIISKGQGNLEGLISLNDSRIFFLLMVKCDVIAEVLNVKKGDFVVVNKSLIVNSNDRGIRRYCS